MVRWVARSGVAKSRRDLLTVNAISPAGVGATSRSMAVATTRKSMREHG